VSNTTTSSTTSAANHFPRLRISRVEGTTTARTTDYKRQVDYGPSKYYLQHGDFSASISRGNAREDKPAGRKNLLFKLAKQRVVQKVNRQELGERTGEEAREDTQ